MFRALPAGLIAAAVLLTAPPGMALADGVTNQRPVPRFVSLKAKEVNARQPDVQRSSLDMARAFRRCLRMPQ